MKILVISNLFPPHGIGGYEERCLHTVEALRSRGHDVRVLTSSHHVNGRSAEGETAIFRELEVHGFFGHPWLPIHKLYALEKRNQATLRQHLRVWQPELVHVWNMGGISKSLLHTLEQETIPLVYDISDHWIARSLKADVWLSWWNDPGSPIRRGLRTLAGLLGVRRRISRTIPTASVRDLQFKNIYFCSQFMRDLTAAKGYPVQHADVIYCGVEAELFSRKQEYQPVRRLLWVGRLAEDKDPLTTVRGFAEACAQSQEDLQLDIYGRGDPAYVGKLRAEIHTRGLEDRIQLKAASHQEMRALYATYDAYIFSSNWGEPFALTPLEAMASGVPVIMCPDGGDAELLEDGVNALGFEAANPASLAEAILKLLQQDDYGRTMAQVATQQVNEKYSVHVMTDRIESFLQARLAS